MKIQSLKLYQYQIDLKRPLTFSKGTMDQRQGLVLELKTSEHQSIYTDIAPLPHFHPESVSDILHIFEKIQPKLLNSFWSLKLLLNSEHFLKELVPEHRYPTLRFALEMALLSLLMPRLQVFQNIPINAYCTGSDSDILQQIPVLKSFQSIKIKSGQRNAHELSELIDQIIPLLGRNQKLRIDFNRSFSLNELRTFCTQFPVEYCDYLEEPLKNPLELLAFSNDFHHPIAYDESLLDTSLEFLLTVPTKKAFVIKPTLLGSLHKINALYTKSRLHKMQFILTSAYESGLGHLMIAQLAHYLALEHPMGLDTYHLLETDILEKPLAFSKDILSIKEQHLLTPYLNFSLLKNCYDSV